MKIRDCKKIKKKCTHCGETKVIYQFPKRKTGSKDGYRNICKSCYYESKKIYTCVCENCNKEFKSSKKNARFCNNECCIIYNSKNKKGRRININICEYCGNEFETIYKNQKYCSHKCSTERNKIYKEKECLICGKKFKPRNKNSKYCSNECKHKGRINKESKILIKCPTCGKRFEEYKSQIKNKKHVYCSIKCKDIGYGLLHRGEKSSRWNKNKSMDERVISRHYFEYNNWRIKVYKRDNFTCKCCGDNKGGNLVAHHFYNYSEHKELRTEVDNGITMCKKCHKEFHDTYGYTNNTEEQFYNFLNSKRTPI